MGVELDLDHPDVVTFCAQNDYQEPDLAIMAAASRDAGYRLAMHNQKQVTDHADKKRAEQDTKTPGAMNPNLAGFLPNPEDEDISDEDRSANEYLSMSLGEIVARYGTQPQFKNLTGAVKNLIQMRGYEEEQARKRGEYIHRAHAERLVAMIDGLQKALLTDAVSSMTNKASVQVRAGATQSEIENAMRDTISRSIKASKSQLVRALRDL